MLFFSPKNVIDAIELTTSIWLCYCGISLRIFKQSYSEESFFVCRKSKNKMKRFFDAGVSINSYSIANFVPEIYISSVKYSHLIDIVNDVLYTCRMLVLILLFYIPIICGFPKGKHQHQIKRKTTWFFLVTSFFFSILNDITIFKI